MARTPESMAGGARVWRVVAIGGLAAAGLTAYAMSGGKEEAQATGAVPRITGVGQTAGYVEEKVAETLPKQTEEPAKKEERRARSTVSTQPQRAPRNDFFERGLKEGAGGHKADPQIIEAAMTKKANRSDFKKSGSDCWLPPGAFIPVRSLTRVVTEKAGILKAKITADVWDTSGTCLVLPAGSDLVADYGGSTTKGEKRVPITNLEIVRPYPADDTVTLNGVAGDPTGAAGVPGDVESNFLSTALLVTASIGIDLAQAALTSGGSLIGPIIGENAGRPIDQIARDLWQRPSVIQVDERTDMLLILRAGVAGDDFRDH
jgi:type IV secretion system protein VirB10